MAVDQGGMLDLLLALVDRLDRLRIVVVVSSQDDAEPLQSYLEKRLLSNEWPASDGGTSCQRIYVGTPMDIMRHCQNQPIHALVYWGTAAALSEHAKLLRNATFAKHTGELVACYLVRHGNLSNPEAAADLEMMAGPVIYAETDRHGSQRWHGVQIRKAAHQPRVKRSRLTPFDWKRQCVWHNARRNELVWQQVQAWQEVRWDRAVAKLPDISAADLEPRTANVIVLVDSVDHARVLQRERPEWRIRHVVPHQTGMPIGSVSRWCACTNQEIVTMTAAARYGIAADVVIRADGSATPWSDAWLHRASENKVGKTMKCVVDFDDSGSHWGDRFTSARVRGYASRHDQEWITLDDSTKRTLRRLIASKHQTP